MRAGFYPLIIGLKLNAKPIVEHTQVSVRPPSDGIGFNGLHFLRNHADISLVASVVAETIKANAIGQTAKQNNIVLEGDIRSSATTAATTATTTAATTTAATCTDSTAAATTAAAHTSVATRRLSAGRSA
jgi:hypothetical protein